MNNKIEFTETAKNEIDRILVEKSPKTYFRISVKGGGCSGFSIIFHLTIKLTKMVIISIKQLSTLIR